MSMKNILLAAILLFFAAGAYAQTQISFSAASNGQTFSTCNGFIIDSGGQGGTGYSNNELVTITLCPDTPGEIISVVFNFINLSTQDDNPSPTQTNVDYMRVYDGTSTAANSLGEYTGNQLQGVVIQATALNPTGCITLQFQSNTIGTGQFTASVACETPCANPTAAGTIVGGITADSIRVCVGDVVNFADDGSFAEMGFTLVDYNWDFMDGNTANGTNVSHIFNEPGQYRVQLFVTDDNGCSNPNLVDLEVLVATIPDFTGFPSDTTLCLGESVSFTADPEAYEVLWDGFPGSETIDDGCLPDTLLGVSQDVELLQTGFAAGTMIDDISDIQSVCVELEHSFMGDIVIMIECPNGQTQILHQQGGGGTQIGEPVQEDNVDCSDPATQGVPYMYCFTPTATETWVEWVDNNGWGMTLPAGDYEPIEPLNNLVGCPVNGVWTLTVIDNWAADDGTLFSFGINLDPSLYPPIETFEPQIGAGADSSYWTFPAPHATSLSPDGDQITIVPTAPGSFTYTYTVIDDFGCMNDTNVTVTVNDNPIPDAGPDFTVCDGDEVQLNGSISGSGGGSPCPFTFNLHDSFGDSWNGNNLLVTINGVTTSYTVPNDEASFTVNIPHGTTFTVQFDGAGNWPTECSYDVLGPNGEILFQDGYNGAPSTAVNSLTADCFNGYTFEWSPAAGLSDPNIPDPTGNFTTPGTLTLTVYPTGHPLCATTDDVSYIVSESAYPGADSTLQICSSGAPADLYPLLGPGASPNGTWSGPTGAAVNMPYNPVTMNPGIYTYSVDSNGCVSSATITVTEIVVTVNVAPTNVSCHGANNGSVLVNVTNGTSYTLNGGAATPIAGSPFTINNLAPGPYTIDVTNAIGCTDQELFTITEPPALNITSISPDVTICPGASTNLTATSAGGSTAHTLTWVDGATIVGTGSPITVTPVAASTQYCVILTEACGSMPDTACVIVSHPQDIIPVFTPDIVEGCFPVDVNFTNNSTGGTVVTTVVDYGDGITETLNGMAGSAHQYELPGVYTVTITVTSDLGCVYTATFTDMITVFDKPQAYFDILPNPVSMFNPQVQLLSNSSNDVVTFDWDITQGTPSNASTANVYAQFPEGVAGNYNVTLYVYNQEGCVDSVTRIVQVVSDVLIYAPNAFTPDGDEFNQSWFIHIDGIDMTDFNLKVFNRWGEIVFESNDPKGAWDGTYDGQIVPSGMYTWTIETKDINTDEKYTFEGHVTILR